MNEQDLEAQISAATAYEELFGPALFQGWPLRVADAAEVRSGHRVLDVACGTGIVARELMPRVGPGGHVAGLDLASGMLAVARRLAPGVDFREGRAESLPWADLSFDAVVCQFGLMFFADRRLALREMLRVLRDGGRLVIAVWDSLEDCPAFAAEVALLERLAGSRAADALRAPFVLGDRTELMRLLREAGVSSVEATTHQSRARFPGVRSLVEADLRGWLPLMGVVLKEEQIQRVLNEAETILGPYVTEDGYLEFDAPAHIATGSK